MAISRILGASLVSDLDRQGVDLQFSTSGNALVYMDFADFRLGINETNPSEALHVNGNLLIADGNLLTNANITYDLGSSTNWFRNVYANNIAAGSFVANSLEGILLTNAQPNITTVGTLTGLTVDGNVSATNITGNLLTAAQPNITTVGNLSTLTIDGQIISTVTDGTAPFVVSSSTQVANLYATRSASSDQSTVTTSDTNETYYLIGVNNSATGNYSLTSTPQLTFNANTDVLSAAGFSGVLQTNAQPNITSVGTLAGLTVEGNVNVTLGNLQPSANLTSSLGYSNRWWSELYANTVTASTINGTILTSNQPNITNLGNISVNSILVESFINLTGNIIASQVRADEVYDSNNRVITESTTININGDDVAGSGTSSNVYIVLSNTGVTAGVYGSSDDRFTDKIPKITVDSKGRITNIANVILTQVGNVSFNDTTISANVDMIMTAMGNIYLDARGSGIVQITGTNGLGLPVGETFNRPENPEPGYIRFNLETENIEFFNGNVWTGPDGEVKVISSEIITPDGISAVFALVAQDTTTNGVIVSINGTLQQPYTAYNIDTNQITFTEIPSTSDIIEVRSLSTGATVSASQLRGTMANVTLASGNVNIAGNLIPYADVTYDIGSADKQWRDLFLSGNTIHLGSARISTDGNTLNFTPAGSQTAVDLSGTNYGNTNVTAYLPTHTGNISAGNVNANSVFVGGESLSSLISSANVNLKGYVDQANTIQSNQITAVSNSVAGSNAAITTANTNLKGYVDAANTIQSNQITAVSNSVAGSNAAIITANTNLKGYVDGQITSLIGGSPATLDTLNEIAAALGNDANLSVTLTNQIAGVQANVITANTNMKGYVDAISTTLTSNAAVQAGSISALELSKANLSGAVFTGAISAPSLTLSTTPLAVSSGGTGSTSTSGALDNLLPAGEVSGYVLSTSGPGSYYWAEPTGGGGTTVGSQISISRTTYTATAGQTVFTGTGTYTIGSNQLRVFINGVRQFPSEYTETSSTSFTVTPGLAVGDLVMAEVDSFQNYTIFANAVVSSAVGGVSATNVQNAIAELDTEKASLSGAVFTGNVTGTNLIASFGLWGTVRTAAQTNITSVGTLGSLAVTGNITAGNVTATNLTGAIASGQVTTALGFTPYNSTNPSGYTTNTGTVTRIQGNGAVSGLTLTGDVTTSGNVVLGGTLSLTSGQVTTALGFTPYNSTNPSGYTTNTGTVTSISGTGTVSGLTLSGTVTGSGSLTLGGTLSLSSGQVTGALGFTPYNSTNPSGFISAVPNASTQVTSLGVGTAASGVTGEIRATNNITAFFSSDNRLKENVRNIPNALDKVSAIGGKLFDWTDEYIADHGGLDDYFLTKESFGVIAQDVEQVFPEAVRTREDGYLAVDYERMCALAFQAIKELSEKIDKLQNK